MSALEFLVVGVPISAQTKSASNKKAWQERVSAAARERIAEESRLDVVDVRASIVWFHTSDDVADLDNIAKPILDGACGIAFGDDSQIAEVVVRRTSLEHGVEFRDPPALVAAALERSNDFEYIRISSEPIDHGQLP